MHVPLLWLLRRCSRPSLGARVALSLAPALTLAVIFLYKSTGIEPASAAAAAATSTPCGGVEGLLALALVLHSALDHLAVPHALCHGTLWAALRQGSTLTGGLPVEFCLLDDALGDRSVQDIRSALRRAALALQRGHLTSSGTPEDIPWAATYSSAAAAEVSYDWKTGTYSVSLGPAKGVLRVFAKIRNSDVPDTNFFMGEDWSSDVFVDKYLAFPAGKWNTLWRFFGQNQVSFPSWHLEPPFQSIQLYGHDFPVPHDGTEMLKYLYPNQWWTGAKATSECP